jgi:hypothetical protein
LSIVLCGQVWLASSTNPTLDWYLNSLVSGCLCPLFVRIHREKDERGTRRHTDLYFARPQTHRCRLRRAKDHDILRQRILLNHNPKFKINKIRSTERSLQDRAFHFTMLVSTSALSIFISVFLFFSRASAEPLPRVEKPNKEPVPDPPCTKTNPSTGEFYDLRPLIRRESDKFHTYL